MCTKLAGVGLNVCECAGKAKNHPRRWVSSRSSLSFLGLGSVLVGLTGDVSNISLKWSHDKSILKVSLVLCVLMMWSDCGWSLGEGAYFKISFWEALSGGRSSLVQIYLSCVHFDFAHLSVHMIQRL